MATDDRWYTGKKAKECAAKDAEDKARNRRSRRLWWGLISR
jgi:hypothetical protein